MSNDKYVFEITRTDMKTAIFEVDAKEVGDFEEAKEKAMELSSNHDFSMHSSINVDYDADLMKAPEGSRIVTREAKYLAQGGSNCPSCGSNDLHPGEIQSNGLDAFRIVSCADCEAFWDDVYKMTGIASTCLDPSEYVDPTE